MVAAFSFDLFRRHVVRRTHGGRESTKCDPAHRLSFRDPEIHNPKRAVLAQHDVGRLHVAMDHAMIVHVLQRITQPARDFQCVGDRQDAHRLHEPVQSLPLHKFHDDVGPAFLFDGNDL